MYNTLRLLSVHLLILLLCTVLAAVALTAALSPAGSAQHGAVLGAGQHSAGSVSPRNVVWN